MKCLRFLAILLMGLATAALASPNAAFAEPIRPGEKCQVEPLPEWTEPEQWAWTEICEGREADFNQRYEVKLDPLDPKVPEGWNESRQLSSSFLETILLDEQFRGALTRKGVRIIGAWFPEPIDLENATLGHELWLDYSRFESYVNLRSLKTENLISLQGSKFAGMLVMASLKVGGRLLMGGAEFGEVWLRSAKIGDTLVMIGSKFMRKLDMGALEVGSNLYMSGGAEFGEVDLLNAKIGDQLSMIGSKFIRKLDMGALEVGSGLFMRGAEFGEVDLRSAKIGGQLNMSGSKFADSLVMESLEVGGSLFMSGAEFAKQVNLIFASIGSYLDLSGATVTSLDMTGARVNGELHLGSGISPAVAWQENSRLILRNTVVGTLQSPDEPWPKDLDLELDGFTYSRLGGYGAEAGRDLASRDAQWFIDWLAKDESYSPQPYQQLASVLRAAGKAEQADDILYAGKERERIELAKTGAWASWLWSTLKLVFIGHGYRIYHALFWIVGLVILGAIIFRRTKEAKEANMPFGIFYSFDMLLPIIKLREKHYEIDFKGNWRPARYYFYVHQLMGYALASFLFAGLSGLTK